MRYTAFIWALLLLVTSLYPQTSYRTDTSERLIGKSHNTLIQDGDYTVLDTDNLTLIIASDTAGGGKTITLPTLADNQRRSLIIKRDDAVDTITVDGEGAETIDGVATFLLTADGESVTLIAVAAEWKVISSAGIATVPDPLNLTTLNVTTINQTGVYTSSGATIHTLQDWVDQDTTPDVSVGKVFSDSLWTGAATITTFDNLVTGQIWSFRASTSNVTINSALIRTGHTMPCEPGDWLVWHYDGSTILQIDGTVGMGTTTIWLDPVDPISDWPASSVITFAAGNTDVSDDGVRLGATAVYISMRPDNTVNEALLEVRPNGTTDTGELVVIRSGNTIPENSASVFWVKIDENGIFQGKWLVAWTSASNLGTVKAYKIAVPPFWLLSIWGLICFLLRKKCKPAKDPWADYLEENKAA